MVFVLKQQHYYRTLPHIYSDFKIIHKAH